jgi:hypothetical protein
LMHKWCRGRLESTSACRLGAPQHPKCVKMGQSGTKREHKWTHLRAFRGYLRCLNGPQGCQRSRGPRECDWNCVIAPLGGVAGPQVGSKTPILKKSDDEKTFTRFLRLSMDRLDPGFECRDTGGALIPNLSSNFIFDKLFFFVVDPTQGEIGDFQKN